MKERFLTWWNALQQRERWILAGGTVVVVCTFVWLLLDPLLAGVSEREQRVAEKEALLAWMQRGAARLPQGNAAPPTTAPVFVINRTIQASGLGSYLKQAQPVGETGVRTQFEAVPFDTLVVWLSQLATQHGLRIESAEFENAGRVGTADARLSLERGGT